MANPLDHPGLSFGQHLGNPWRHLKKTNTTDTLRITKIIQLTGRRNIIRVIFMTTEEQVAIIICVLMIPGLLLINIPYSISKIRKIKELTKVFWLNSFLDWTIKVLEKFRKRQIKIEKQTLSNFQQNIQLYVIFPLAVGFCLWLVTELTFKWILLITIAAAPTAFFFKLLYGRSGRR